MEIQVSRRQLLAGLFLFGTGCVPAADDTVNGGRTLPREDGTSPPAKENGDSVDALIDVMLPDARDAGADQVLTTKGFLAIAIQQGLVPALSDETIRLVEDDRDQLRRTLGAALDAIAQEEKPLARYADLPRDTQEAIADRLFDDETHRPAMLAIRAACFFAWLGGFTNDKGLRAIGFPPFENFDDGLACSGYPRPDGDDYTYARAPAQVVDLSLHLDVNGDLP